MLFDKNLKKGNGRELFLHGWNNDASALFLSMILAEVASSATPDQLCGFFVAVGKRIATCHPVGNVKRMDNLVHHANTVWETFQWGEARFEVDDEGIDICHQGFPQTMEGDVGRVWSKVAPSILQGAYDEWFRQAGSGGQLRTRILRDQEGCIELRHGI